MEPKYELEEGEAGYHGLDDADDTSIDPDIALSYLDEKVQSVLGHFQKDFEGGVSAENLGAKFGGYGSFLPTHQRSPSVLSQPKSPPRFHSHNMPGSPKHLVTESAPQNSLGLPNAPLSQKNGVAVSGNSHSLLALRGAPGDGSVRKGPRLPSAQVAEKCLAKDEPYLNKSVTSTDQRTLKVRIKVHPHKTTQKNAAIYSGLGLSSPSSMESSPVESGEMSPDSQEACDESPGSILQVMTSFPVAGDLLLSPLHDHLLALSRNGSNLGCGKLVAARKNGHNNSSISTDASTSSLGNANELKGKKVNSISQSENFVEPKNRGKIVNGHDTVSCLKKNLGSETLENKQYLSTDLNAKDLSDLGCDTGGSLKGAGFASKAVRESDEAMPSKKRELISGKMKDISLNSDLINDESVALITGQGGSNFDNRDSKSNSMEKIGEHQVRGFHKDNKERGGSKEDRILTSITADSDISEGRKDSKGAAEKLKEVNVKATSHQQDKLKILDTKKKTCEGKKKSVGSQLSGKSASKLSVKSAGSSAVIKNKKNSGKDVLERTSGHKLKESKLDAHRELQASSDKSRLKSAHTKIDNQLISGKIMKETSMYGIPSTREPILHTEEAPPAPFLLIEEDWVLCDKCQKWRLLPQGMKPDHLPSTWVCSMLNWLPGMNSCDFSEDETTGALNALYVPLPENPNNLQTYAGKIEGGVNPASACDLSGNRQNASYTANLGRKKHKVKRSKNDELLAATNFKKSIQGEMVKGRTLVNVNQTPSGSIPMRKLNDKDFSEQGEHVVIGDEKSRKKIKREPNLSDYKDVKKIKADSELASGVDLGMLASTNGLPTKVAMKEKHKKNGYLKETKSTVGTGLRVSVKKQDHMHDSLDNGSLDIKACNEREISTKKRKFKDSDHLETLQSNVAPLGVSKVSIKDESSDGGFKKHKKCKISQTEANESSTSKSEQKPKARGAVTRIILPSSRNSQASSIVKDQQVKKYKVKMKPQLTLDDIDSLRKDLGCEELSTAATSSSSKVSDSRKRRANYQVKGSPVESVSSSPMRTYNLNSLSPTRKGGFEKDDAKCSDFGLAGSPRKSMNGNTNLLSNGSGQSRKGNSFFHAEAFDSSVIHPRDSDARDRFDTDAKLSSDVGNGHLGNSDAVMFGEHMNAASSIGRKDRLNKKLLMLHHQKTVKNSPLQSKEKDKDFGVGIKTDGEKVSDPPSDNIGLKPTKSLKEDMKVNDNHLESGTKFVRNSKNLGNLDAAKPGDGRRDNQLKCEDDWSNLKFGASCNMDGKASTEQRSILEFEAETAMRGRSTQVGSKEERSEVDLSRGDKQATLGGASRPPSLHKGASMDASVAGNSSKMSKAPGPVCKNGTNNSTGHPIPDRSMIKSLDAPNLSKRDASNQNASNVLREAEELRDYADRLKSTGFDFEYNEAYFQAALKFLHGASLLETCSGESGKYGEANQIQIYTNTAKLCETCANEYQKRQEMATAALAYKCMEVAYMRVVYCKNMSASRVWHDLQASLQMPIPLQGESPSSSASDVDNTNNQAMIDRTALSKVNGSQPGTHVIAPRNRPNFVKLLDFAKDVNAAMEASRRAQNAFGAANIILEEAQNLEAISSVKQVIDFSFQDVEELTRLVRLAIEAISRQSIGGNR
ncbi:uncharacterized protein LOC116032675 [Ipomoea triloba]|uniref:uncharacterized protein LOC116032675 n=1 Tax=Ipomoea triloba TaxID=35885 RepID=UPI00125E3B2F|nr:uncharacterized protein LOC116032675 [Ipomoea triloba]